MDEALELVYQAVAEEKALSIGLIANAADVYPELVRRQITPDVVTDQTSSPRCANVCAQRFKRGRSG